MSQSDLNNLVGGGQDGFFSYTMNIMMYSAHGTRAAAEILYRALQMQGVA